MYEFSILDLWPYIGITLIFILCYVFNIKDRSKIIYITLLLFCIFRYDVGWDYSAYVEEIKLNVINERYEPLSKLFLKLAANLHFYPLAFILFAWPTLLLVYKSIEKYSNHPTLSWLVYFSLPLFFFASLSTIRQSLAAAIILYSYKYLKEGKNLQFFISILIASLFHLSGIAGIFLWIVYKLKLSRIVNIILFIISFIFPLFVKDIIMNFLSNYIPDSIVAVRLQFYIFAETQSPTLLQYLYYAFAVINLLFYDRLVKINESNKQYISFVTFGVVIFNLLSFEPISATRISAFFLIFLMYIIPYYPKIFPSKYQKLIEQIIFLLLITIVFFYLWIYISAYKNTQLEKISFIPYKFWFNHL
jgi:hypothetical protein